jgi:asparagine synthase (glutamine-hydrolysing)
VLVRDYREYEEELDRLFVQAVRRQLVSDVPVGAYLSGGIDSGAITAIAAREMPYLASFTVGFDLSSASGLELGFDERQRAEALSYRFKTEHYEVVLKAGDMERVFPELIWHLEDLRVGQCYPNYYISRLASKFVKVVLAGTGGDELFAGYPWRYYRAVNNLHFEEYVQKYYKFWQRLVQNKIIHRLFQPPVWDTVKDSLTIDLFRSVIGHDRQDLTEPEEYINRSLHFEMKTFMHGLLLVEDKLNMAHGLESRVPFLDNDLVDFAMQLPVRTKLRELDNVMRVDENEITPKQQLYFEKTNDGKLILRSMLSRYLPQDYVTGVKQGFSAPDASWFRGESIEYVRKTILDPNARIYEFLRPDTVSELVEEHLSGKMNRRLLIWSLLSFEWWLRKFVSPTGG